MTFAKLRSARALLVAQAALVWADETFDREEFIEHGTAGKSVRDVEPYDPAVRKLVCENMERRHG